MEKPRRDGTGEARRAAPVRRSSARRFLGEAAGALAVMAGFVALALAGAAFEAGGPGDYPPASVSQPAAPTTWLVDGFNVLHAAVLRGGPRQEWWREENRSRVVELARGFDDPRAELVVVFDGGGSPDAGAQASAPEEEPRPRVVFAASADEWMLAALRAAPDPGRIAVVTADRQLADRARHRGAQVVRPSEFAARCRGKEADS